MRLERGVPELILMFGQRDKIHYHGIKKMCKNCYKYHKENCSENRVMWNTYAELFKEIHPQIPVEMIDRPRPVGKVQAETRPVRTRLVGVILMLKVMQVRLMGWTIPWLMPLVLRQCSRDAKKITQ
jgi:hypothetical protein